MDFLGYIFSTLVKTRETQSLTRTDFYTNILMKIFEASKWALMMDRMTPSKTIYEMNFIYGSLKVTLLTLIEASKIFIRMYV